MIQPSQTLMSEDATRGLGATSAVRCFLPESEMRAVFVVVGNLFADHGPLGGDNRPRSTYPQRSRS